MDNAFQIQKCIPKQISVEMIKLFAFEKISGNYILWQ